MILITLLHTLLESMSPAVVPKQERTPQRLVPETTVEF
jgi:hypothetical protein